MYPGASRVLRGTRLARAAGDSFRIRGRVRDILLLLHSRPPLDPWRGGVGANTANYKVEVKSWIILLESLKQ